MSDLFVEMQQRRAKNGLAASPRNDDHAQEHNIMSQSSQANGCGAEAEYLDEDDQLTNILSLKLKKPKNWKWELSTSRSCSNIALPRILLYNHKGDLLVDANSQQEQVFKQPIAQIRHVRSSSSTSSRKQNQFSTHATTDNLDGAIRQALAREFGDLQIAEATPSPEPARERSKKRRPSPAAIELQAHELPDYKFERRANSCKEVRFKVDDPGSKASDSNAYYHVMDLPTPPSTTTTTTTNSSSGGPREKRRYRRSQSTLVRSPATSESILERLSSSRGRFSSPEFDEEHAVQSVPRYYLRTSNAGTLVVQEHSFSRVRRRRKLRNSSTENMLNDSSGKCCSTSSLKMVTLLNGDRAQPPSDVEQHGSLQNVAISHAHKRRKVFPVRRYRSDGNMLLAERRLSSSGSEAELLKISEERKPLRRYGVFRKKSKNGLITIDADNGAHHSLERPTAR